MDQALVLATDPIFVASTSSAASSAASAASTGICAMGAAICSLGAFAAGFAASELKSYIGNKRKFDQLEAEVSKVAKKVRRQEMDLRVSAARTRGRFKTQHAVLARKADAAFVAEKLGSKVSIQDVDTLVTSKVAHLTGQPPVQAPGQATGSSTVEVDAVGNHCATHSDGEKWRLPKRLLPERLREKYPDRIPVICRAVSSQSAVHKLLVPKGMLGSEVRDVLIKRIKKQEGVAATDNTFQVTIDTSLKMDVAVSESYDQCENKDGILHVMYSIESV